MKSECGNVNSTEMRKYRELLQNVWKIIPRNFGSVNKKKLKFKDIKLSSFTGKEEDLFLLTSVVLDILKIPGFWPIITDMYCEDWMF